MSVLELSGVSGLLGLAGPAAPERFADWVRRGSAQLQAAPSGQPYAQALTELRDIHLPDAVAAWPPAPGWWIAAGIAAVVATAAIWFVRARRRSLRRAAIAELARLDATYRSTSDLPELARGLSALLRRTALARFGRRAVAGLHGSSWIDFLHSAAPARGFPASVGVAMVAAIYARPRPESDRTDADDWVMAVAGWIRSVT